MKRKISVLCLIAIAIATLSPIKAKADDYKDTYLSEEIVKTCEAAERVYGIDAQLLEALIETESSGRQYAVNKYGDCIGLCQLNPKYMKEFVKNVIGNDSFDWYDIEIQVFTCCEYLNYLKDLECTEGDIMLVLQAYNEGPEAVREGCSNYALKITKRAFEITMAQEERN